MSDCSSPRCECMHGPEDCPFNIGVTYDEHIAGQAYVTDPNHGGKITCHKCNGFIKEVELVRELTTGTPFHINHYNAYEHYYGLDKSID